VCPRIEPTCGPRKAWSHMLAWHLPELGAGLRNRSAATGYEAGSAVDGKEPTARMVRCHHVVLRHGVGEWVTIRFLVPVRSMLRGRTISCGTCAGLGRFHVGLIRM
jgi:hypothetical protein